jgi:hypothetical protein
MPYSIRKVPRKSCFRVSNRKTKRVFARCTSKTRAQKQVRLLRALENNRNFVPRNSMNKTRRMRQ